MAGCVGGVSSGGAAGRRTRTAVALKAAEVCCTPQVSCRLKREDEGGGKGAVDGRTVGGTGERTPDNASG